MCNKFFFIVVMFLIFEVQPVVVQVSNDTPNAYIVKMGKRSRVLERGDYCEFELKKPTWWQQLIWQPKLELARGKKDGWFRDWFAITRLDAREDRIEISINDVARQSKSSRAAYRVKTLKKQKANKNKNDAERAFGNQEISVAQSDDIK